jgi:tubulin--tyrosine ligase
MCSYYRDLGYDPFEVAIPVTYHIKAIKDTEFAAFSADFRSKEEKKESNVWIIKPGENSNRGCGIQVAKQLSEIKKIITQNSQGNQNHTSIVQLYIDKPLLINGRKFDIRIYAMLTSVNGVMKGFMYRDCYFRTSSKPFDLTNL